MSEVTSRRWRFVIVVVLASHALIHLVGALLLWEVAEVGEFTYDMATPAAGTGPAFAVGSLWLAAAVLFLGAAVELGLRSSGWRRLVLAGCAVSVPVLAIDLGDAGAGLVVDVVLAALALAARPAFDAPVLQRRTEDSVA